MPRLKFISYNKSYFMLFLFCTLVLACSNPNTDAPDQGSTHAFDYVLVHASEANDDLEQCTICHRDDFRGAGPETDCLACHDQTAIFEIHDVPYLDPGDHGADAKNNMDKCLNCHGTLPNDFDGGILTDVNLFNLPNTNCSSSDCHSDAGAHPTDWIEADTSTSGYRSTHTNAVRQNTNCILCHDYILGRSAPNRRAPSCFSDSFTNGNGSTSGCHPGGGVGATHAIPYTAPQAHGTDAKADLSACQECHGTPGKTSFDGGVAVTSCATSKCHPDAGAHPTRWQGNNDNTSSYRSTHRNAGNRSTSCSICHDYNSGRTPPNPSAPSCFTGSFRNSDGVTTACHDD